MPKPKLLLIGDHFISPRLMGDKLGSQAQAFQVIEACTEFPFEPYRDIAEVREASGSEEQMIQQLQGVTICIAHHAPLTRRVLESADALRLFVVCRGGPVNVNLEAATQHGVIIGYTPGRNAAATAEHTVAMILSALRGIPRADAAMRRGEWKGDYTWETAGFELEAATVGLIGYGSIGKMVGRILCAFGARVLVYDPLAEVADGDCAEQVDLPQLLRGCNIVSLHARETTASRGILGVTEIAQMPKGSVIVNCARGSLLDYDALASALRSGHLFAAAADVFPVEPLPESSPLRSLDNFIMTPHIAGGTRQAAEKAATFAARAVQCFLTGEPLPFCANPEVNKVLKR